jgi:hypothetical protein
MLRARRESREIVGNDVESSGKERDNEHDHVIASALSSSRLDADLSSAVRPSSCRLDRLLARRVIQIHLLGPSRATPRRDASHDAGESV